MHEERTNLSVRLSEIRAREGCIEATLTLAREVQVRAERINDAEAKRVAEQAEAIARAARADAKAAPGAGRDHVGRL
jgi:hypothetical protein